MRRFTRLTNAFSKKLRITRRHCMRPCYPAASPPVGIAQSNHLSNLSSLSMPDRIVPIFGIGTAVGNINTYVESVTYSEPTLADVPGLGPAFEISGVVSGVEWGGAGIVARARDAHYTYAVAYVARWPQHGGGQTLVMYHHGAT